MKPPNSKTKDGPLSQQDRDFILAEERYRREVAHELDGTKSPTWRQAMWDVMNSNIVIWLLGSVMLALVTFTYQVCMDSRTEARNRTKRLREMIVEFDSRVAASEREEQVESKAGKQPDSRVAKSLNEGLSNSVIPEFKGRPLASILFELGLLKVPLPKGFLDDLQAKARLLSESKTSLKEAMEIRDKLRRVIQEIRHKEFPVTDTDEHAL